MRKMHTRRYEIRANIGQVMAGAADFSRYTTVIVGEIQ